MVVLVFVARTGKTLGTHYVKREEIFINAPPANKRIDLKSLAYPQIEQNWQKMKWCLWCGAQMGS